MAVLSLIEIIEEAYERIQVDPRGGNDYKTAKRSLNILMSDWNNRGLSLWTIRTTSFNVSSGNNYVPVSADTFDVMDAVVRTGSISNPLDLTLDRVSASDYLAIPYKNMPGTPTRYMVQRLADSVGLILWQVPNTDVKVVVNELVMNPDIAGYTDAVTIPLRFQNALISGLAYHLAVKRQPQRAQEMMAIYEMDYDRAGAEDRDRASFFVAPDIRP